MNISVKDILAILRRFNIATNEDYPKSIDKVEKFNPTNISFAVRFRFNLKIYFILFDETADDTTDYITNEIKKIDANAQGLPIINPINPEPTYGLPFKGKGVYLFETIPVKIRLDVFLTDKYPNYSRSTWQKYIKVGCITVNGSKDVSPKLSVSSADKISITLPTQTDYSKNELPIIYIDDDIIVINKPTGILTHSKGALNDEFTVADFFRRYTTVGLDTNRPGIVHRLDRDTSGVLIGARTPESCVILKSQFAERIAKKEYIAITNGIPKQPVATIDIPIARNPSSPSKFKPDIKGKHALTHYESIVTHTNLALLKLTPKTGRTHQLRVHLAYIGTPILGDKVYGKPSKRLYLHAKKLELTTTAGKRQTFTAPVPREFIDIFKEAA